MSKYNHLQEKGVMTDYLYTILLELLSEYEDEIVVFGSVMLNKKYDSTFNPSDLDITKLYNPNKSIAVNRNLMKEMGNDIYQKLIKIDGINSDFYKKIDFICILSLIYAKKNSNFKGYLDMNILYLAAFTFPVAVILTIITNPVKWKIVNRILTYIMWVGMFAIYAAEVIYYSFYKTVFSYQALVYGGQVADFYESIFSHILSLWYIMLSMLLPMILLFYPAY